MAVSLHILGYLEQYSVRYYFGVVLIVCLLAWILKQSQMGKGAKVLVYNSWIGIIYLIFFLWEITL
ncbi:MAG: hypothetical protein OXC40_07290, partial [Proteobacteria bacterium]|nr:hypothetical protein [Pseudomonadota bacterium]